MYKSYIYILYTPCFNETLFQCTNGVFDLTVRISKINKEGCLLVELWAPSDTGAQATGVNWWNVSVRVSCTLHSVCRLPVGQATGTVPAPANCYPGVLPLFTFCSQAHHNNKSPMKMRAVCVYISQQITHK